MVAYSLLRMLSLLSLAVAFNIGRTSLSNSNNINSVIIRKNEAFHSATAATTRRLRRTPKLYISNLFRGDTDKTPQLPKDVKEAVSKCREAVQKGLENKLSRMVRWSFVFYLSFLH